MIKTLLNTALSVTAALAFLAGAAQPARAQDGAVLEVHIDGADPAGGQVRAALFDQAGWLSPNVVDAAIAESGEGGFIVRLTAPEAGRYGVAVFQDVNGDGELNRGAMGRPSEPYGFTNDAPTNYGPPRFLDAAIDVPADGATTRLRLR